MSAIPAKEMEKARSFYGTVVLKEWWKSITGTQHIAIRGQVTILPVAAAFGFTPSDREVNWLAVIQGKATVVYMLGCQIRAATEHAPDMNGSPETYLVP